MNSRFAWSSAMAVSSHSSNPPGPDPSEEAQLLELYRRMRPGQKDMLRELAELMVNRDPPDLPLPPKRPAQG